MIINGPNANEKNGQFSNFHRWSEMVYQLLFRPFSSFSLHKKLKKISICIGSIIIILSLYLIISSATKLNSLLHFIFFIVYRNNNKEKTFFCYYSFLFFYFQTFLEKRKFKFARLRLCCSTIIKGRCVCRARGNLF